MRTLIRPTTTGRTGRRDPESGSTAIEFVIWTPLLLFMILIAVQFALYLFAEHVASTAAQAGARVAREEQANPNDQNGIWQADAQQAAQNWIDNLIGQSAVTAYQAVPIGPTAIKNNCAPYVGVTVSFTMDSLLGGMNVSGTNEGPVENFYPAGC